MCMHASVHACVHVGMWWCMGACVHVYMSEEAGGRVCEGVPGLFWHPWWVYLMVLYSALLNGAALLAQILPYGVFEQPP